VPCLGHRRSSFGCVGNKVQSNRMLVSDPETPLTDHARSMLLAALCMPERRPALLQ